MFEVCFAMFELVFFCFHLPQEIKIIRVDGTIHKIFEREARINLFQTDPSISVFLLTTQVDIMCCHGDSEG